MASKILLSKKRFTLTIERLAYQIIEDQKSDEPFCIIAIQPRGVLLANRIAEFIREEEPSIYFDFGIIDPTFYRDDFRRGEETLKAYKTDMPFLIEGKQVFLVDDVLFTGRTIQAAMSALLHYGRPERVSLVTLIDRKFKRHLPIQSNYSGLVVDTMDESYVQVFWEEGNEKEVVLKTK